MYIVIVHGGRGGKEVSRPEDFGLWNGTLGYGRNLALGL